MSKNTGSKNKKIGAGFTLIELTVITIIILILSSIFLANYRTGEKTFALQRAANKLAQDIRRAAEMATAARECQECGGIVPPGYGIFIEAGTSSYCPANKPICYILYADTAPTGGNEFYSSADTVVEPPYIQLEKGVFIKDINTGPKKVCINFKPPDPTIKVKYQLTDGETDVVIITLALESDPAKTKTVIINKAGLIDID